MPRSFAEIRAAFEREARSARAPRDAGDLPFTYEAIRADWLTAVLARDRPGAVVLAHSLGPAQSGTSVRRRIHLTWNERGRAAGLPTTVFCKGTLSLESRYMLGMNEGVQAEVNFYNQVRPTLDLLAPRALFARFDPETLNSIVILEDLAATVEFCRSDTELSLEQARSQMRLLASLHARFHESPELGTTLAAFSDWETFFTITANDAGFGAACVRGFAAARDVVPERLFRREAEVWPATLACVALHTAMPRGLIHSDVHLANWYVTRSGELGLNDWQCASRGNGSRDLAYTISTALPIEKRRLWERELLAYYAERMAESGGPKLEPELLFRRYRQQLFAALAWWTGTLGQPPDAPKMQPPEVSREFIRRMATAIDDLDALDSF